MTATDSIKSQEIQTPATGVENQEPKQKKDHPPVDALLLAYMFIFESVQINHQSAAVQAKQIESNASAQNKVIRDEENVNFAHFEKGQRDEKIVIITANGGREVIDAAQIGSAAFNKILRAIERGTYHGKALPHSKIFTTFTVKTGAMQQLQLKNQEISAVRSVMENKITVLRQSAQVGETNLNSAIDDDEQALQEGGSLMQMLNSLTQQITRI